MSYTVSFLDKADDEFQDAVEWYEAKEPGLGNKFAVAIVQKLYLIAKNPKAYAKRKGNSREVPVGIFPYNIVFLVQEKNKNISVSSIFHTSRNPKKKYRK